MNVIVSVIMPAFNAERYISESIDSVLKQTFQYWELIVIDDGSIDRTKEIILNYRKADNRIIYIYQENKKQGGARNFGISIAKGKYLAFLDSDDIWMDYKLHNQILEIEKYSTDLVFSDAYYFKNDKNETSKDIMNSYKGFCRGETSIQLFIQQNQIPILTVLAKKSEIIKVNGFTESYDLQNVEDYHLWLKMLLNGAVFWGSEEVYARYRDHDLSATFFDRSMRKKIISMLIDLSRSNFEFSKIVKRHIKSQISDKLLSSQSDNIQLSHVLSTYKNYLGFFGIYCIKMIIYFLPTRMRSKYLYKFIHVYY